LPFYVPISKEAEAAIWAKQKARPALPLVSDEERVEDAGLEDDADIGPQDERIQAPA
jgi:hypothetical protein